MLCMWCGSSGSHFGCRAFTKVGKDRVCSECFEISAVRKYFQCLSFHLCIMSQCAYLTVSQDVFGFGGCRSKAQVPNYKPPGGGGGGS